MSEVLPAKNFCIYKWKMVNDFDEQNEIEGFKEISLIKETLSNVSHYEIILYDRYKTSKLKYIESFQASSCLILLADTVTSF